MKRIFILFAAILALHTGNAQDTTSVTTTEKFLEQVVVVGYQTQKRSDVSGSLSVVNGLDLKKIPTPSVEQALQGRAAGVQVSNQTGAPGSAISVRIRGVGSISSSNDPLYIVDGIPVENGLANIAPGDIENITVLKDASSAAIYGSRANNGVVLVTTKSGAAGKTTVQYNTQLGVQLHGRLTPMVNTEEYINIYNEATRADNANAPVPRNLIEGSWLRDDFADINYLEEIFRPAFLQSHEFSVSGGNEKTQYLLGISYFEQQGIILNTNYNRLSFRSNVNSQIKKWLKAGLNLQGSTSDRRRISSSGDGYAGEGGSVVRYAFFRNPAIPIYNTDGSFIDMPSDYFGNSYYNTFLGDGYNPVGLTENTDMTDHVYAMLASGNIQIDLPENFSIKGIVGADYSNTKSRTFNPTWGSNNRINATNSLDVSSNEYLGITANATLNHHFNIKEKNHFNWMLGTEIITQDGNVLGGSEGSLSGLYYLGFGTAQKNPYQSVWQSRLVSFFGSLNYNYDSKYYISALIREDGSSRFSRGNRLGTFYSVSASWNMERENFMQDQNVINKFKWRVGYGAIGNQNISLYANTGRYQDGRYYALGGTAYNGYIMTQLGNSELKWETSNQLNAGIDMEFFRGQFGVTVDYYHKITSDMLVQATYPPSVGSVALPWVNNGSVLNTGVDLEVFYRKNFKNGGINIAFNGGYLHNEVLKLNAPIESGRVDGGVNATRTVEGQPIGSFYLYEMEGIFQNEMEIYTHASQGRSGSIKPGDVMYKDNYEDGVIDANDRIFCGSAIPRFTMGLNISADWYGIDLSIFFQGAFGQKIYTQVYHDIEGFYRGFSVTQRYYDEHWTPENPSNTQPRAAWSAKQNNARAGTTRFLEDGSYLRLKNIQLGYTIPNTKKIHIENLRIYLAATNVATITGYSGLDPEMTVSTNSLSEGDRANGIDWGTYPVAMTFTFGLNLTF
ncbi:MAG: TonB-dependent receptor [Bacteroidales bacterium]|jgi:TonB-linked SusC/RagA family outer membrane protein|nr:TonB-dependent receptor [Bacteroidales bacterium]